MEIQGLLPNSNSNSKFVLSLNSTVCDNYTINIFQVNMLPIQYR